MTRFYQTEIAEQAVGDRRLTAALLRSVLTVPAHPVIPARGFSFARLH